MINIIVYIETINQSAEIKMIEVSTDNSASKEDKAPTTEIDGKYY